MVLEDEFVQVDENQIGLDRSNITYKGQIQLPEQGHSQRHDDGPYQSPSKHVELQQPDSRSSTKLIKDSFKQKTHDASIKIKKTLHISKTSDELVTTSSPILANTAEGQSDSRLNNISPIPEKHTLKDLVHHPVETITSKVSNQGNQEVAANVAVKEISHGQEVDLVNASTAVERARTEHEKLLAIQNLSELLKERQSTYVRWTLDRHVTKIRIIPRDTVVRRPRTDYQKKDVRGEVIIDWKAYGNHLLEYYAHQYGGQYIEYGSDPPAPSKETIMPNIERLIVASSPVQEFVMTTRRVYRWENRAETTKYLLIYLTLWYFNLLLPGIMSAVMYHVLQRHYHGNSLEDLREDIKHREDVERTALSLTELIVKEGDEDWSDKLLEGLGSWAMIQLADLANFCESMRNFYEWTKPTRTKGLLGVLGVAIIITAIIPIWLLVKSATLSVGITFFGLFPIAVNFPDYRLLVSPSKRLLWNIPTHAEWAIQYIQAEGTRVEANAEPSPSALPIKKDNPSAQAQDYGFYNGHYDKSSGHIVISTSSVRFVSKHSHNLHFTLPYDQISQLEKLDRIVAKNVPKKMTRDSGKDLKLVNKAGQEWVLKDIEQRNEAFSQIVGFSNTTWQVVW
ncbi:Nn.00g073120.m01.CDS01 [Neocucurbitaria sp. VM-36]